MEPLDALVREDPLSRAYLLVLRPLLMVLGLAAFWCWVRVEGREQALEFRQEVTYANKSFIGQSDHDSDELTLKLTWEEGEKKHLEVRTAVWR